MNLAVAVGSDMMIFWLLVYVGDEKRLRPQSLGLVYIAMDAPLFPDKCDLPESVSQEGVLPPAQSGEQSRKPLSLPFRYQVLSSLLCKAQKGHDLKLSGVVSLHNCVSCAGFGDYSKVVKLLA